MRASSILRVVNPETTLSTGEVRKAMMDELQKEWERVRAMGRLLCGEIRVAEAELLDLKRRATDQAKRGVALLTLLGYDEEQALKEIRQWRSSEG